MTTLRELKESLPKGYIEWWDLQSEEEQRKSIQDSVDELGMHFSPDPQTLIWLLEKAGIRVP